MKAKHLHRRLARDKICGTCLPAGLHRAGRVCVCSTLLSFLVLLCYQPLLLPLTESTERPVIAHGWKNKRLSGATNNIIHSCDTNQVRFFRVSATYRRVTIDLEECWR